MKLFLYHGREDVDQEMDDWGFDGPLLEGVKYAVVTYFSTYRIAFTTRKAYRQAKALTGWDEWDEGELCLEMRTHQDGLVVTNVAGVEKYYGDWCLDA
jgi:hypothetical protein